MVDTPHTDKAQQYEVSKHLLPRLRGWLPLLVMPLLVVLFVPPEWPRWGIMWVLAVAIYAGCKWLTWRRTPAEGAPLGRHLGYLFAWPGLDARRFLSSGRAAEAPPPSVAELLLAASKLTIGVLIFYVFARLVPDDYPYLVGWVGMIGIVMILHFGTFHLLSCAWRSAGVEARPLMNWPLSSTSLAEFWGRRWNTAFRDLTHRFLFRPLTPRLGTVGAVLAGFVFSGIVHDFVISWPAGGGYGGPTVFFLLQGAGIIAERSRVGRSLGLGRGWRGWLFTMTILLGPVVLLFHPPFVIDVVVPFMQAVGAIGCQSNY